jgi:hypothetical protein
MFGKRFSRALAVTTVASLVMATAAFADSISTDGDTLKAGNNISYGAADTGTARLCGTRGTAVVGSAEISRTGSAPNLTAGEEVTLVLSSPNAGIEVSGGTGTVPSTWTGGAEFTIGTSTTVGAGVADGTYTINATATGGTSGTVLTDTFTVTVLCTVTPSDTTAPVITPSIVGTLGNNGWYTSNVTVTWSVVDAESAISSSTGCDSVTINADTAGVTLTCSATSAGGTASESITIQRDATAPTLTPSVSPNPVLLNGTATASPGAADAMSGVASSSCDLVDTNSVGPHSVTCYATDNAGNTNSASASYNVVFAFTGFDRPVDNGGVLNVVKAGQAIPLKFRVSDANGVGVTTVTSLSVTVVSLACTAGVTSDEIEEYAAGSSGLQNLGDGYYQYNWKTPTSYANSCKTMRLNLFEGGGNSDVTAVFHTALFQFRK